MNVSHEASIPAWYSSLLLLSCAILLFITTYAIHVEGGRSKWYWGLLGLIFLYLSIDEAAELHEILTVPMRDLLDVTTESGTEGAGDQYGILGPLVEALRLKSLVESLGIENYVHFTWVIVGVAFVGVVGLAYIPFLLRLPKRTCWLFVLAGLVYVGGAIGVESVSAKEYYLSNATSLQFPVISAVEEFMEMAGAIIFMYALLDHLGSFVAGVEFQLPSRATAPDTDVHQEEPTPQTGV